MGNLCESGPPVDTAAQESGNEREQDVCDCFGKNSGNSRWQSRICVVVMQHPDASSVAANTVHVPIRFLGQNQGEFGKMKYVSTFLMTLSLGLLSIGCGDTAPDQAIDPDGPDPNNMGPSTGAPAGSMGGDASKGETAKPADDGDKKGGDDKPAAKDGDKKGGAAKPAAKPAAKKGGDKKKK